MPFLSLDSVRRGDPRVRDHKAVLLSILTISLCSSVHAQLLSEERKEPYDEYSSGK